LATGFVVFSGLRQLVGFGLIGASANESANSRLVLASQLDSNVGGGERDVERYPRIPMVRPGVQFGLPLRGRRLASHRLVVLVERCSRLPVTESP
jgi:hypothetical protein